MKVTYNKLTISFICLMFLCTVAGAQDIKTLIVPPKASFSGGIFASGQYYNVRGIDNRRSPYSYNLAGNLTFKLSVITVPLSFSFRDQQFSYGHSFNKFGMSPYYKWIKVHIGHRSMRFSNYTLGGKNFFGGGLELTPGKFRFAAFAGNMQNPLAQRDTLVYGAELIPTYKRSIIGGKIGVGSSRNYFDLIVLHIKDRQTDDLDIDRRKVGINPSKNIVMGTEWKTLFFKKLNFNGTINASVFTENLAIESSLESVKNPFLNNLFELNASSKLSLAGEAELRYNFKYFGIGAKYRRIEPNYRSLGIPFLQADIENYTFRLNTSLFKAKFNTNANVGIERNNLRNLDYLSRKRLIVNLNTSWMITKELLVSANFSNFKFETTDGLVEINDTLRYINVSRMYGLNFNYTKKSKNTQFGVFGGIQQQSLMDLSPVARIGGEVNNVNVNAGVRLFWKESDFTVSPSLIVSSYGYSDNKRNRAGVAVTLQKSLFDKILSFSSATRLSFDKLNGVKDGRVLNQRFGINCNVLKHSQVNFSSYFIAKKSFTGNSFNETRLSLGYGLKF